MGQTDLKRERWHIILTVRPTLENIKLSKYCLTVLCKANVDTVLSLQQITQILDTLKISFMSTINNCGPSTDPCGTPHVTAFQIYDNLCGYIDTYQDSC